ncbi:hypothetical protein COHA_005675 [Chlorella ohadii]|uniref:UBX domain-containing protein n=1 Tax=Chlorella ohadii TaxID=2649997 RepID=A0AAD5DQL6_9CHLO|nr:hypothetical protein COHA_005675 [Chlorella ohadii]
MDVDDQAIARFMEATHASAEQAQFFLEACGGDFDRAMNMFYALAGALRALTAAGAEVAPARAAEEFARAFTERYGEQHPVWQECGWGEAASRAHQEAKFLFVYLHSPQHQDTDAFCRGTLCDPGFAAFVNQHFVAWGGDLRRSDAFRLASSLRVARYPYTALLAFSGPRTRLITCVEGRMDPQRLQDVLQAGLNDHGALLWQERLEREQRETDRRLREEQDAEYQRSLEADRQREAAREAAAREAAEAERAAREAAERARAEAEAAEAARAASEAALRRRQSEKALALPAEPPAGTPGSSLIRIRLPDGSSHQRRFLADGPLQAVYDWVDSLEAVTALNYSLATTFPRRVYGPDTREQSLQELGLAPQAVLLMQSEDD